MFSSDFQLSYSCLTSWLSIMFFNRHCRVWDCFAYLLLQYLHVSYRNLQPCLTLIQETWYSFFLTYDYCNFYYCNLFYCMFIWLQKKHNVIIIPHSPLWPVCVFNLWHEQFSHIKGNIYNSLFLCTVVL